MQYDAFGIKCNQLEPTGNYNVRFLSNGKDSKREAQIWRTKTLLRRNHQAQEAKEVNPFADMGLKPVQAVAVPMMVDEKICIMWLTRKQAFQLELITKRLDGPVGKLP